MKETILNKYICNYCSKEFNTAKECEHHEKQHAFPTEILNIDFFSQGRYPCLMQVKFDNGNTVDYVRNDGTSIYASDYSVDAQMYQNNSKTKYIPRIIWNKVNVIVTKAKTEFFGYWNRENDMTFETLIEKKYREQWISVGDNIYKCYFDKDRNKNVVIAFKVYDITDVDGVTAYNCGGYIKNNAIYSLFKKYEIGGSVFLTKQDAQRLADKKNENII